MFHEYQSELIEKSDQKCSFCSNLIWSLLIHVSEYHPRSGRPISSELFELQVDGYSFDINGRMTVLQNVGQRKATSINLISSLVAVRRTRSKTTNTLTHLMSPYYTERRPNHNLMYTMDHTFSYHSKNFIYARAKSSVRAHGSEIRGGNLKLLETTVGLEK